MKLIKKKLKILIDPKKEFSKLHKYSFEAVLTDYLRMLILFGAFASGANFLLNFGKAIYLSIFTSIDIQYLRMINYLLGRATSIFFLSLFIGTVIVFLLSLLIKPLFKGLKYTQFLQILMYSLTPILFFGWILPFVFGLMIWAGFLAYVGYHSSKEGFKVKKGSIQQRE